MTDRCRVACVAEVDRIALQPFHRGTHLHAADGRADDVLHIADGQPIAGGRLTIDVAVQVIAAKGPLGVGVYGAGYRAA